MFINNIHQISIVENILNWVISKFVFSIYWITWTLIKFVFQFINLRAIQIKPSLKRNSKNAPVLVNGHRSKCKSVFLFHLCKVGWPSFHQTTRYTDIHMQKDLTSILLCIIVFYPHIFPLVADIKRKRKWNIEAYHILWKACSQRQQNTIHPFINLC